MRRPHTRLILSMGIPMLIVVVLLAVWAIDSASASGKVPRNVTVGGRDISKLAEDELAKTVADLADHYANVEVQVRTPVRTYKAKAGDLGLELDQEATVRSALELDENTSLVLRPFVWLSSFIDERIGPLSFSMDSAALETGVAALGGNNASTEPKLVAGSNAITILSGNSGSSISPDGLADQILRRARSGEEPIIVTAIVADQAPAVSDTDAQALADRLTLATASGLTVTAGANTVLIPAATVRSWLGSEITSGKMALTLNAEKAKSALTANLPADNEVADAKVTLVYGVVVIIPSKEGKACCAPDTASRLLAAINGGQQAVTIDLQVTKPKFTTEDAQKLGIKEPVGTTTVWAGQPQVKSFTTYYPANGGGRIINIHRIADLVRGTIVKPGEIFSVNGTVGQRTTEKGFVEAGAIADGEHVTEVGGGVSQFATTMFNAAYFAGLDITIYQAHSEWFSRYPRGREATMGFPNPDLAWRNDTPYGILIWTSWTADSVTVQMWSTQYGYGEQTGATERRSGNCTLVATERTVRYPTGKTATETFNARYRDEGKTSC